jgi:hypothetical protein
MLRYDAMMGVLIQRNATSLQTRAAAAQHQY